jgi:hypothetical protein
VKSTHWLARYPAIATQLQITLGIRNDVGLIFLRAMRSASAQPVIYCDQ